MTTIHFSLSGQILLGLLFSLLFIVSVTGNILVCIAIYSNKKLRKKENLYFVSLAGADLLLSILVMPFAAINDVSGKWLFGQYCKIWMSFDIMCCTCSILHLCAISFDRYFHIHDPLRYAERMSTRLVLAGIGVVWTLSTSIAFAPWLFGPHFGQVLKVVWAYSDAEKGLDASPRASSGNSSLREEGFPQLQNIGIRPFYQCSFTLQPGYAVVSSMVSFYVPCMIMIAAYAKLYRCAHRHAKSIKAHLQTAATLLVNVTTLTPQLQTSLYSQRPAAHTSPITQQKPCQVTKSSKQRRDIGASDSKARVTLGAIVGLFILSWLPFFVCNIVRSFCVTCVPDWLFLTLTWMGYANSAQNPIIYTIFNRDFRRAFAKILACGKRGKRGCENGGFLAISGRQHAKKQVFANGRCMSQISNLTGRIHTAV